MLIPALLNRGDKGYQSLERDAVLGLDGSHLCDVSRTPPMLLRRVVREACGGLQSLSINAVLDVFKRAGEVFLRGRPDDQSPEEFVRNVALNTGLPIAVSRSRTLGFFPEAFQRMDQFLRVQSPSGLDVFDSNIYRAGTAQIGFAPRGKRAGFVMPGNHPSTHFTWLGALAMKVPVVVRPSADDLFTPYRLCRALLEAGLPEDAIVFAPGGHDIADCIVEECSLTVLFGGQSVVDRYASNPRVKIHGPGQSKVVVLDNADFDQAVDLVVDLVMDDAGRGCNNASSVVVEGSSSRLAAAVAKVLSAIPLEPLLSDRARIGAVRPGTASALGAMIDRRLDSHARQLTPPLAERVATHSDMSMLRPCVIETSSWRHPLFAFELPFPFVVFSSASREELVLAATNSLAVVIAGDSPQLVRELLLEPTVGKVFFGGSMSTEFDPREPHEGFLLDFLYQKKALRNGRSVTG